MSKQSPEKTLEIIIRELKEVRKQKGLSHEVLAQKVGIHRSAISLIESGKRSPTLVICLKIAKGLDAKLSLLLSKAGE